MATVAGTPSDKTPSDRTPSDKTPSDRAPAGQTGAAAAQPGAAAERQPALRAELLAMINASWTTQALAAAVELGLPALLVDGPRPATALAAAAGCDQGALLRLLRALTSLGVLNRTADDRFALTDLGNLLRSDVPGSLAAMAEFCGTRMLDNWRQLSACVRSGLSARQATAGAEAAFAFLEGDSQAAMLFHRAMVALTAGVAGSFVNAIDLAWAARVVDVGGGHGELLAAVLSAHPSMQGLLFDLGHATTSARESLAASGVAERCEISTGDFFNEVPAGGDVYLLKSILHDWDDRHCAVILHNCRAAMHRKAKLFVIERLMPEHFSTSPHDQSIARSDLNMLVGPGGRERTEQQYRTMLAAGGLRMVTTVPLTGGFSACEAEAVA